jgi:hypothetical protein
MATSWWRHRTLGMEHQSAIAYGNNYVNGYRGSDLSGTGHGLAWDYIIIHESGHEWFGNSITTADIADMWVHEGFTDYTETIFTECQQGPEAAQEYVIGLRKNIRNDRPIIGPYGVNEEGSGDMYYKGANLIHMIRHIVGDSTFKDAVGDDTAPSSTGGHQCRSGSIPDRLQQHTTRSTVASHALRSIPAHHEDPDLGTCRGERPPVDALGERGAWPRTPGQDA